MNHGALKFMHLSSPPRPFGILRGKLLMRDNVNSAKKGKKKTARACDLYLRMVGLECGEENGRRPRLLLPNESSHGPDSWTRLRAGGLFLFSPLEQRLSL